MQPVSWVLTIYQALCRSLGLTYIICHNNAKSKLLLLLHFAYEKTETQGKMLNHLPKFTQLMCVLRGVWLFVTPWTVACQAPLSIGFPRQEYWSRLSFPTPGDLRDPGIEHVSLTPPALAGRFFTTMPPGKPFIQLIGSDYLYLGWLTAESIFALIGFADSLGTGSLGLNQHVSQHMLRASLNIP